MLKQYSPILFFIVSMLHSGSQNNGLHTKLKTKYSDWKMINYSIVVHSLKGKQRTAAVVLIF